MSAHAFVVTTHLTTPLPRLDREQMDGVAVANHLLPVAWLALFDESSIVQLPGEHSPTVGYFSDTSTALQRLERRRPVLEAWFPDAGPGWIAAFRHAVSARGGDHVQLLLHDGSFTWNETSLPELRAFVRAFDGGDAERDQLLSYACCAFDEDRGAARTADIEVGYVLVGWLTTQPPPPSVAGHPLQSPYAYVTELVDGLFEAFARREGAAPRVPYVSELLQSLVVALNHWATPRFGLPAPMDAAAVASIGLELTVVDDGGPRSVRPSALPADIAVPEAALEACRVGDPLIALQDPDFLQAITAAARRGLFADGPCELGAIRRTADAGSDPERNGDEPCWHEPLEDLDEAFEVDELGDDLSQEHLLQATRWLDQEGSLPEGLSRVQLLAVLVTCYREVLPVPAGVPYDHRDVDVQRLIALVALSGEGLRPRVAAGQPLASMALIHPDPRVRVALARAYCGDARTADPTDVDSWASRSSEDDVWRALAADANPHVRLARARNEKAPADAVSPSEGHLLVRVASPQASLTDVLRAAVHPSAVVREQAAASHRIPRPVAALLAGDASLAVRLRLAGNASVPLVWLGPMVSDADWKVRSALVRGPRTVEDEPATRVLLQRLTEDESRRVVRAAVRQLDALGTSVAAC